jgi:hypothetical protein
MAACMPGFLIDAYGTFDRCVERVMIWANWNASLPDSGLPMSDLTTCSSVRRAQSCDAYVSYVLEPSCRVFGTRQTGQPCTSNMQCVGGRCSGSSATCGVCLEIPRVGASCSSDAYCDFQTGQVCASDSTCQLPRGRGEPCTSTEDCDRTLQCGSLGTCEPKGRLGDICGPKVLASCDTDRGYYCHPGTGNCRSLVFAGTGEACAWVTASLTDYTFCRSRGTCSISSGYSGICLAGPKNGQVCNAPNGPYCTFPDLCIEGTCREPSTSMTCPVDSAS